MLEHGGQLLVAVKKYGRPAHDWLDLSTGIAPWPYPVPPPPAAVWQRLPEAEDGLEAAARAYYGCDRLLMLPGSQAAIQWLPRLFPPGRVAMPAPLYAEHPACWRAAGHEIVAWDDAADYAVLCNPGNPTGIRFTRPALLERARTLRLLVVDEAFIDAEPTESLAAVAGTGAAENIVVLRSLGKFFGLAGARGGCAIAAPELLDRMREALGPWAVSHPARWAARHALADRAWQAAQRERLGIASLRLDALLRKVGVDGTAPTAGVSAGTPLFRYIVTPHAARIHVALAEAGILVRLFEQPAALRFGLPSTEADWQRLADTLKEIACLA